MLFSSMTFIYMFLPILCLIYFLSKKKFHNTILLIASLVFYAWGEPKYLAIMILTIIINYYGALFLEKYSKQKKVVLVLTILINLSFLIYFKYFNFIFATINNILNTHIDMLQIIMPLGISFYTFQSISYIVDVYRGEAEAQKDIYKLALFICLFPQLIAGPIVKYHDVNNQIENRDVTFEKVAEGVKRFIMGLSKKMLIANTMGAIADKIFILSPESFGCNVAWLGAISYSLQLYFDFSGYSDMAIGLGLMFGFRFKENFNYPYISKSITEFWRRWHISLSTWFKEYVYIPLGGNRKGEIKTIRNLGIVFLLTGIWHGAAWNFIIWGVLNGLLIIAEKILKIKTKPEEQKNEKLTIKILKHFYTIISFVLLWVIFRAENMTYATKYIMNMFGLIKPQTIQSNIFNFINNFDTFILVIGIILSTPLFIKITKYYQNNKIAKCLLNIVLLLLLILSTSQIASSTYNPFIYFRF